MPGRPEGFNGDIAQHARRWRDDLDHRPDVPALGRRIARKSLLAVAGLVSMHDETWTTDRQYAATRWAKLNPRWAEELNVLAEWSHAGPVPDGASLRPMLDGVVAAIVRSFETAIGLWADPA